jgi:F-box and WD-40 domain protein CDC4
VDENPYHKLHLEGHDHAVRALAARGRTLVSGSYDCTVRIWDIITGTCKWILVGHTQKGLLPFLIQSFQLLNSFFIVYSVVLDPVRNQACSGSMDGTVRVWNLRTGQCQHTLTGHTSLVGLLGLSSSSLVSAAADSTLRIWDPDTGALRHALAAHTGAITCFQHDEFKVLSGSDGTLKMWDVRDGSVVRDLLTGITGVWQVVFEGRWCVAASNQNDSTKLDVWDFGNDEDDDWVGEPAGGIYDDDSEDDEDQDQADLDAMDQDLVASEIESVDVDESLSRIESDAAAPADSDGESSLARSEGTEASMWAPGPSRGSSSRLTKSISADRSSRRGENASTSEMPPARPLPPIDETPTRPKTRTHIGRKR